MVSVTVGLNIDTFSEIKNLAKKNKVSIRQQIDDIFAAYKKCELKSVNEEDFEFFDDEGYNGREFREWLEQKGFLKKTEILIKG